MCILARTPTDGDELESDYVNMPRLFRREVIGEAQIFSCGLSRECEARALRALIVLIDDEIVALRLAREVAIDEARREQTLALRSLFDLFVNGSHLLCDELLVFVRAATTLLELPLTFE